MIEQNLFSPFLHFDCHWWHARWSLVDRQQARTHTNTQIHYYFGRVHLSSSAFQSNSGHMVSRLLCGTPTQLLWCKQQTCSVRASNIHLAWSFSDSTHKCRVKMQTERNKSSEKVNKTWPKFTLNYEIVVCTARVEKKWIIAMKFLSLLSHKQSQSRPCRFTVVCRMSTSAIVGCHAEEQYKSEYDISI